MHTTRGSAVNAFKSRVVPLAIAITAAMMACSTVYAASFGHSRILSQSGQPLRIDVPITELSPQDQQALVVEAVPLSAWAQAGLTPPVDPASLQFRIVKGFTANSRIIQVRSPQPFSGAVADLLVNVRTASGQQQHRVSLLAYVKPGTAQNATVPAVRMPGASPAANGSSNGYSGQTIRIRRGDTMFALARRNAVPGVTVFQLMVALQRANPQAFIHDNLNLIKEGGTLTVPDRTALTAISDKEARLIFQRHAQAFAQYRQSVAARKGAAVLGGSASSGSVSVATDEPVVQVPAPGDEVVLSGGAASTSSSDDKLATERNVADSKERVSQLEENVKSLNQALQMQGEAAKDIVVGGAKSISESLSSLGSPAPTGDAPATPNRTSEVSQADTKPQARGTSPQTSGNIAEGGGGNNNKVTSDGPKVDLGAARSNAAATEVPASPNSPAAVANSERAQALAEPTGGSGNGTEQDSKPSTPPSPGTTPLAGTTSPSSVQNDPANPALSIAEQVSNKADSSVSWFQDNLLAVVTALLALIVLVVAWLLRRANSGRDDDDHATPVDEAMVQAQLDKINLDLQQPPVDEPRRPRK